MYQFLSNTKGLQAYRMNENLNEKYLGSGSQGQSRGINRSGQAAYMAIDPISQRVMVDGTDYYTRLYAPYTGSDLFLSIGAVDDDGLPFWSRKKTGEPTRIFHGTTEISAGYAIKGDITLFSGNGRGDCLWTAQNLEPGAERYEYDVFLNNQKVSAGLLGQGRHVNPLLGAGGKVLWAGAGAATGGAWRLFMGTQDITPASLNGSRGILPQGLIESGEYLTFVDDANQDTRLFLGATDYGATVFGDHPYLVDQNYNFLGQDSTVFWQARDLVTGEAGVYLNHQRISANILGPNPGFATVGLDAFGHGLWYGKGDNTDGKTNVFVNDFNISKDALRSDEYVLAWGLAMGANGQALWVARNPDQTHTFYLSTPVPEPLWLSLLASVLAIRCGKHRLAKARRQ